MILFFNLRDLHMTEEYYAFREKEGPKMLLVNRSEVKTCKLLSFLEGRRECNL